MRFTVRQLMILVAIAAAMILLEIKRWRFPLLLLGPLGGAILHKMKGGNGLLGGMISGGSAWAASGLIQFAIYDNNPRPHKQWTLSQQAVGIIVFAAFGAVLGLVVGASVGRGISSPAVIPPKSEI